MASGLPPADLPRSGYSRSSSRTNHLQALRCKPRHGRTGDASHLASPGPVLVSFPWLGGTWPTQRTTQSMPWSNLIVLADSRIGDPNAEISLFSYRPASLGREAQKSMPRPGLRRRIRGERGWQGDATVRPSSNGAAGIASWLRRPAAVTRPWPFVRAEAVFGVTQARWPGNGSVSWELGDNELDIKALLSALEFGSHPTIIQSRKNPSSTARL